MDSGVAYYAVAISGSPDARFQTGNGSVEPDCIHVPTEAINKPFSRSMLVWSWTCNPHSVALLDLLLSSRRKPVHSACLIHIWRGLVAIET